MTFVGWALGFPALLVSSYLALLALASRRRPAPRAAGSVRFDVIVPAHDEEQGIAATVRSLLAADYDPALRRVLVVADNCGDATAARARAAGATVLVRDDRERRGKGHALAYAFERSLGDGFADAVVVVDADTTVTPNFLHALAARVERGEAAVQAGSAVLNPRDSWRTQLMQLALTLFNGVRSLARENLGLSCGLRGNGMCLRASLLRAQPWTAFSIVEDLEYGLALGRAGVRVAYAHEAQVRSVIATAARAAATQRRRWELGRFAIARRHALSLLRAPRTALKLELAIDLLVPPLSLVVLYVAAGCLLFRNAPFLASAVFVAVYVARGWQLSGIGPGGFTALARAPFYVLWKLAILLRRHGGGWDRTPREGAVA